MSASSQRDDITSLLLAWRGGDEAALTELMPVTYRQLKAIAGRLLRAHHGHDTLETTALVHESYLRLVNLDGISWTDRAHFFAMCARLMRRVLVDHARHHARAKRGGGEPMVTWNELHHSPDEAPHLLELDEALRELAEHDAQMARIVELRFFGGLHRNEIAEVLQISSPTVTRRWRSARAWLIQRLKQEEP